jgi:addiction module RelE/StbE family toxin
MIVSWSKRSIAQLDRISRYIDRDNSSAAERLTTHIFNEVMLLSSMADRGKPGRVAGTREKLFLPYPYFAVYRIVGNQVRILHIRHTSRRWPTSSND